MKNIFMKNISFYYAFLYWASQTLFSQIEGFMATCIKNIYQCQLFTCICYLLSLCHIFGNSHILNFHHSYFCYGDLWSVISDATAAKSLQSCPTLCSPIDGSPLGSPVLGILQARTLEWVTFDYYISNSTYMEFFSRTVLAVNCQCIADY